jgi:hypothetical protein
MHIHGGVTIGSGYTQTSNPTNGLNVEGAIQQAGNQVLHAGNYTSYSPSLSGNYKNISVGGLYSRYNYNESAYILDSTSAYSLSPDYGQTTVAMHNSHGSFGDWATTLTMSGYERYGAYQISGWYNSSTPVLAMRNYNQGLSGWTSWTRILSSANYSSYAVPLSGATMTGELYVPNLTVGGLGRSSLNSVGGNIGATTPSWNNSQLEIKNTDAGSLGIAFHRAGYTSNTISVLNDGAGIRLDGNIALHAGNYSNYAAPASHSHGYIPINPDGDGNAWEYADNNPTINGVSIGGGHKFGADGSTVEGFLQAKLLNAYNGSVNSAYGYYVGNTDFGGVGSSYNSTRIIDGSGNITAVQVQSSGNNGFKNDVYYASVRNPIWCFANATSYGISYYQGSAGVGGGDTIGFSVNGTTSATSNNFAIAGSASYVNNNVVLHAGNYSSYAMPLTGGVLRTAENTGIFIVRWLNYFDNRN